MKTVLAVAILFSLAACDTPKPPEPEPERRWASANLTIGGHTVLARLDRNGELQLCVPRGCVTMQASDIEWPEQPRTPGEVAFRWDEKLRLKAERR